MDIVMITLRLLHIVFGVFWAGAIFFFVSFLEPSIRESMPEGGKVTQALIRRGYLNALPGIAAVTILAGFALMWKVSGHFSPGWFSSGTGRALSLGALS